MRDNGNSEQDYISSLDNKEILIRLENIIFSYLFVFDCFYGNQAIMSYSFSFILAT